jgi:hypothetical protein
MDDRWGYPALLRVGRRSPSKHPHSPSTASHRRVCARLDRRRWIRNRGNRKHPLERSPSPRRENRRLAVFDTSRQRDPKVRIREVRRSRTTLPRQLAIRSPSLDVDPCRKESTHSRQRRRDSRTRSTRAMTLHSQAVEPVCTMGPSLCRQHTRVVIARREADPDRSMCQSRPLTSLGDNIAGVAQWLESQPSKLAMRVRFPSPAHSETATRQGGRFAVRVRDSGASDGGARSRERAVPNGTARS